MFLARPVSSDRAAAVFETFRPHIQRALKKTKSAYTVEHLLSEVHAGGLEMFELIGQKIVGIFLTRVYDEADTKTLHVVLLAGDGMREWFGDFNYAVGNIARERGCRYLTETGRKGWLRFAAPYGWSEGPVTMMRAV